MACVAVNHGLWDAAEQLVDHDSLVLLWHAVEGLLDDMAAEGVHAEVESVAADCLSDGDDLFRGAVLEAALHEKVAEAVDHERVGLVDDGLHNLELLVLCADLELLLEEDRRLLVIVADDLIDNVLPVAAHVAVQ